MNRRQQFFTILTLGSLSTISPFSIDMYLPAFPSIAKDLNTTIDQVQLSLTAYLIGIAAGQLLYGPLLDRFGRKMPLYIGLIVYLLSSLACALTQSVESLIVMRFFQAVGGCAGMVAAQTLVRDLFPSDKTAQAYSWITLVIAVSPMIAPTVGGYVTVAFGWHAVFIILAALSLLIVSSIYFVLPEGKQSDASVSLKPFAVLTNFYGVIKTPQFIIYGVAGGIAMGAPFAYIAGSSDVFMNIYGASEQEFGWIFAIIAFAIIGSSQLNHILLKKFNSRQIIRTTLIYQTIVGVLLLIGTIYGWYGKVALVALVFGFFAGQGVTGPNTTALSLAPFGRYTGSAAALLGSFRMIIAAVVSGVVSKLHNHTAIPMVSVMVCCVVTGLVILSFAGWTIQYRAKKRKRADASIVI